MTKTARKSIPAHPEPEVQAPSCTPTIEALRRRFDTFKPKSVNPDLHRDLNHGWLLPALLSLDACLWQRWDYWLLCHEHAEAHDGTAHEGAPLGAPIPQLDLLCFPHPATRKMLEASLNCIPSHGQWQIWGGWQFFDFLLDWLLFGLGHKGQLELPAEPGGCEGATLRLYQVFCLDALLLWPHDYFGTLLTESAYGKKQGFYPTPHTICEAMTLMMMDERHDHRCETVCDPCVGTGRMLLHASNHSLRLYGMDIDPTLCKATLVNGYLYAPWLVRPLPHLDPELAVVESATSHNQEEMEVAAMLSQRMAQAAPPHAQDYLHATEHDPDGQRQTAPILKRRKRMNRPVDPSQGTLFDLA